MSNIIKKQRVDKEKELAAEIAEGRKAWQEKQENLLAYLNELKCTVEHLPNYIEENSHLGQDELSKIITLQDSLLTQEEERKVLWAEEETINELNKKHAVIHTDQFHILTEKTHPVFGGIDFTLESKESFKSYYEPYQILCADGKERSKATVWLKSPLRRTYDGIIFDPTGCQTSKNLYNIWRGFAKEIRKGDASKYWNHFRDNICAGNAEAYNYVRKWLAFVFQKPHEVHTALVLCGSQGVGKNSFVEPLGVLLGQHYKPLSSLTELISNFNFHLKNAVLIHANEALWGGHRKEIGTLKAMITEKTCLIEGKGKDRIMVKNFKHLILSSNEDWPVHLDRDDRRFFVLRVSEARKEDHAYFAAIQKQLDNGGYEALLYDLLHEDLNGFNPRTFPHSNASFDIKMIGQDSTVRYIYTALLEGHFYIGGEKIDERSKVVEVEGLWQREIPKNMVYEDYRNWCTISEEKKLNSSEFGKTLSKFLPSISSKRGGSSGKRINIYVMPELTQCRKEFCKAFNEKEDIFRESEEQNTD